MNIHVYIASCVLLFRLAVYVCIQTVLASQNTSTPASSDDVHALSSLDLSDVMDDFSQMNILSVVVACLLLVTILHCLCPSLCPSVCLRLYRAGRAGLFPG